MKFISKYRNHRLTMTPIQKSYNEWGAVVNSQGKHVQFTDCSFDSKVGAKRLKISESKLNDWLLNHFYYGIDFWGIDENNVRIEKPEPIEDADPEEDEELVVAEKRPRGRPRKEE